MTNTYLDRNFTEVDFNPFEDGKQIEKTVAINEPQREIWLSCMLGGDEANLAYNESVSLDLQGTFNIDAFCNAIQDVIARHEALRSTVSANGESLIIYKELPVSIDITDISSAKDQALILRDFVSQEMQHVFDLQEGPFIRTFLHKLSETHYYFTLVGHHIACDGWSIGVILEDISKIYNAKLKKLLPPLERADQISEYAVDMIHFKASEEYLQTKNYWLDIYKDGAPTVDFPTDYPRPLTRSYKANRIDQELPVKLIDELKQTGIKHGCSLVNTLLSAFEVFLYLKTDQQDLVVGMPSAGQAATGKFNLVGHCVNLLALKSHVEPEISFSDYLRKRKSSFFSDYENQNFTFGELIQLLDIKRDHSRIPLSPIVFNVDIGMDYSIAFDGLTYKLISNPRAYETFEIFLNITASKSSYIFEWSYNTQLFRSDTIEKITREFEDLLTIVAANPATTINELAAKNADKWHLQLNEWNDTANDYDRSLNVFDLIDAAADKYADKPAISFKAETLTYAHLSKLSDQLAAYLVSKNIKPGDIVGLAADRSIEMVVSLIAVLKAGAAYVPLDPEYPKERIEFMLADSNAKLVLVSKAYSGKFASNAAELILEDIWPEVVNSSHKKPAIPVKGDDLAYVLYTSGSTGKPKGVKIRHFNLVNFLFSLQSKPGISPTDRMLAITTISFDVAGMELFLPLVTGAEIVLSDRGSAKDAKALIDIVEKENITIMSATPSTWLMLVDNGWVKKYPLKVWTAGEALSKELAGALLTRCDELWNLYGPTETTIISILKQIHPTDEQITIGWPINNTQIYICDEQGQPVLPGKIGEILIGGDGVAEGYLNREELTNERFINDPFTGTPNTKLYKTGDLGKFSSNGDIQYLGRADNQIKVRGIRVEPGEIETLLAKQKNIKQSVVIAREDKPGDVRLVAYVLLKTATDNTKALIDDWKDALKITLPGFMVPGNFVILDSFPLTPNNKIDKKALPKPQQVHTYAEEQLRLPHTENEKLVFDIWSDVLGIDDISIDDDFFEIGGHSILAVKMMSQIEKKTGRRFPLSTLLQNATIAKLAARILLVEGEQWDTLVPIKSSGKKTPVYLIHGGGLNILLFKSLNKYFDDDQPVYGIQAFGLTKDTEIPTSIEEAAKRHIVEILKNDPNGPYALAGYSLGGYIAFEIAKQLKSMGKEITLLGIIDTYAVSNTPEATSTLLAKKLRRQFSKIPFFIRSFFKQPGETLAYQVISIKHKLQNIFMPDHVIAKEVLTDRETDIYKVYEDAYNKYIITPLNQTIHLFRVKKRLYFLDDLVYLGWNKFTTKSVEIYEIPGDHKTFLYPPNDKEFAIVVQKVLDTQSNS